MRMNTAHNKLQFEQSKPKKPPKNSTVKQAQKKSLQKRQNKGIFKKQQVKNAKKAGSKAATQKASGLIASKAKYAALGVLGVIILILVPISYFRNGTGKGSKILIPKRALLEYFNSG